MTSAAVLIAVAGAVLAASLAAAQEHQPYAGLEARAIKGLSEEAIADLRAGRGMGLALAAELNGYPGPRHVIELAEPLGLTATQRAEAEALFEAMHAETVPIGERLIAAEAELDRLFAERSVTPESLEAAAQAIGRIGAELRAAHLKYHLSMDKLLTPEQVQRYAELRGYGGAAGHGDGTHRHPGAH
jgi:Spy/CpxP family protein refolding chaperone